MNATKKWTFFTLNKYDARDDEYFSHTQLESVISSQSNALLLTFLLILFISIAGQLDSLFRLETQFSTIISLFSLSLISFPHSQLISLTSLPRS